MLSCDVKLCEQFWCQKLLKSDNIPQLIANNISGCFFLKHGVCGPVSLFSLLVREQKCKLVLYWLLVGQNRQKLCSTRLRPYPQQTALMFMHVSIFLSITINVNVRVK